MKNNSIFINVSRLFALVDTKALLIKKIYKKFLGIGLDVTNPEPLAKNLLFKKTTKRYFNKSYRRFI